MKRREFLKISASGAAGAAAIIMGSKLPFLGVKNAFAAGQSLDITITDAMKQMVTHNAINDAQCYFWIYTMTVTDAQGKITVLPPEQPGPTIYADEGDTITINTITNSLDEPHSFVIPGIFDSGTIAAGATVGPFDILLTNKMTGAHLYYDNLNEPVNRVMGLHGALVVEPKAAKAGHNLTPYANPTPHVQRMYDMFGTQYWPGLRWEDGDKNPLSPTPPCRSYVWIYHQASPRLQAAVGNLPAGQIYDPALFLKQFTRDAFSPTRNNNKPEYFTINGQSGFFSHFIPAVTPCCRVGEPIVVHILNAGLQTHSHHWHCNHFFITAHNKITDPEVLPHDNPIWIDIYGIKPMERVDYTFPFMRPPDNANVRGIGRPDKPLLTAKGNYCWPALEEMQTFIPAPGQSMGQDAQGRPIDLAQRLSPLAYPAHDHLEPSQTAQGGNYNCGLISGAYVIGDRNAESQGLGNHLNFPMDADFKQMFRNIYGVADETQANRTNVCTGNRTIAG